MFDYYLLEEAYEKVGIEAFQNNLIRLNETIEICNETVDTFHYSQELYDVSVADNVKVTDCIYYLLPDKQFCVTVLPRLLQKLKVIQRIHNYGELCNLLGANSAFWGECFQNKLGYCLCCSDDVYSFRFLKAKTVVTASTLSMYANVLFKKIVLCDSAYSNLNNYSQQEFKQILERLLALDNYNQSWVLGDFAPKNVTLTTSLNVSYESDKTNNNPKLAAKRYFQLPNGKREYFEPHIKSGNFRIHFYPQNSEHIIYVGYIGPHLPI